MRLGNGYGESSKPIDWPHPAFVTAVLRLSIQPVRM